ncbi:PKD domain-containing protein [Fulvivirga sp.]|uniref:PKD domain-containing protein n=1 Tax=Fulvivirga sp. TaxID=1931237 RepID=UPI0032EFDBA8
MASTRIIKGQCALADFDVQATVCLEQVLELENLSTGTFDSLIWDFCSGDLDNSITINSGITNTSFGRARSVQIIKDNETIYAFAINASTNNLIRLDFDNGINETPVVTNLGSLNNSLNSAFGFELLKSNGVWYMFVTNSGGKNILRLTFANGIEESPAVDVLNIPIVFNIEGPNSIRIVEDAGNFYGFVTAGTSVAGSKLVRLNFGVNLTNSNPIVNEVTSSLGTQPRGIDLVKQCENWYGFVVSLTSAQLYQLDFGTSLDNNPVITELNTGSSLRQPTTIKIRTDGNGYFGFIQSARVDAPNAALQRINFGPDLGNTSISIEKLIFTELIGGGYALDVFNNNSVWTGITFNLSNSQLLSYEFQDDCSFNMLQNISQLPNVVYNVGGEFEITLGVRDINGSISYSNKSIIVTSNTAPSISFTNQTICQSSPIQFNSQSDGTGLTFTWDFGDTGSSMGANPTHSYASAGEYEVTLSIEDGTCGNFTKQTITVYPEPAPDFTIPGGNICTNQNYLFTNDTPGDFDGLISFSWELDGSEISTETDLEYTFESGGTKELKLIASIPGCDVEIAKNVTDIKEGTLPLFVFNDACEGEPVQFTNQSVGTITDYNWDFGNGFASTLENPELEFSESGTFEVTLELTNSDGCITSDQKMITIHPLPDVAFEADLACENLTTQFNDLSTVTLDNLNSWSWDFGDGSDPSNSQNATHVFEQDGNYNVKLIVGTSFGCLDSLTQTVTVLAAPEAEFSVDKLCEDVVINFSDESVPLANETITDWTWNIGGVFRGDQNPSFTFVEPIDYPVSLTVTSENLCTSTIEKVVSIPPAPTASFEVDDNCTNELTRLTDITEISGDEIISWDWMYDGQQLGTEPSIGNLFSTSGSYLVSMNLLTANGCEYEVSQNIEVNEAPQASFNPSTTFGAPELDVDFENASIGAVAYQWDFNDGNTSDAVNPNNKFISIGEYDVQLIAISEQECRDTVSQRISVLEPMLDLEIQNLILVERSNGDAISLTISNSGSIRHDSLLVTIDLGGEASFQQIIRTSLPPQETITRLLDLGLSNTRLEYLCATVESFYTIEEENAANNNSCITYNSASLVTSLPYPNPSEGIVFIDLITTKEAMVQIQIINNQGHLVSAFTDTKPKGNNSLTLDMSELSGGAYLVRLKILGTEKLFRVMISN